MPCAPSSTGRLALYNRANHRPVLLATTQSVRGHGHWPFSSSRKELQHHEGSKYLDRQGSEMKQDGARSGEIWDAVTPSPTRNLTFLLFPFPGPTAWVYRTRPNTEQRTKLRWRLTWLYRVIWLLGVGGIANTWILSGPISTSNHAVLNQQRFTPFSIVYREEVSPTSFMLTLRPHGDTKPGISPYAKEWSKGTWSVEFKQPQLQIARSYTPLPPLAVAEDSSDLWFLIRKEKGGEVSNYLARLSVGDTVEIRGPHLGVDLTDNITDVVFLAGGTGIAPAMQVAYTLLDKRTAEETPRVHIIWANRKRVDCVGGSSSSQGRNIQSTLDRPTGILVDKLRKMQQRHPKKLVVDYVVDEEGSFLDQKKISALTRKAPEVESGANYSTGSKLLFVSGPEGFVNFLAGPRRWEDGEEKQGELAGLIGRMKLKDWKVWKL